MARQPLEPGTNGKIGSKEIEPGSWKAWARFRDLDGTAPRVIERTGPTQGDAIDNLKSAFLQMRSGPNSAATLAAGSRLHQAAELFLQRVQLKRKPTTYQQYRRVINGEILPSIGSLRGYEATVPRLQQYMDSLETRARLGTGEPLAPNSRRNVRKCLRGIMQTFVRCGALPRNPCNELDAIEGGTKKPPRAYDAAETREFMRRVDADAVARRGLLNVLVRVQFYSGCRLGEALALRWADLNLTAEPVKVVDPILGAKVIPPYTVWINGNIVRVTGKGLVRSDLKTSASQALVGLPPSLAALLLFVATPDMDPYEPVFLSRFGGWRCPNNTGAAIRRLRDRIGRDHGDDASGFDFSDFTSHVGRKSYGTALDASGQSARQIADALRKASVTDTLNTYMGRKIVNPEAAQLIESYFASNDG